MKRFKKLILFVVAVLVLTTALGVLVACGESDSATYTVTFKAAGQTVHTVDVNNGEKIKASQLPSFGKEGYDLEGWFVGDVDVLDYVVKGNVTANAKLTAKQYTVTFKNGETVLSTKQIAYGTAILASHVPAKPTAPEGKVFDGWYVGDTKVVYGVYVVKSDVTMTAKFADSHESYSVVFKNGTEVVHNFTVPNHTKLSATQIPDAPAAPSGKTFEGWYVGDVKVEAGFEVTGNITAVAKFKDNGSEGPEDPNPPAPTTYTVTFKNGETVVNTLTGLSGNTTLTAAQIPSVTAPEGKKFEGWFVGDVKIEAGYTVTANVTAVAKFVTVGDVEITFVRSNRLDEGAQLNFYEEIETRTVAAGTTLSVSDFPENDTFVKVDWMIYKFDSWMIDNDFIYSDTVTVTEDTIILAYYAPRAQDRFAGDYMMMEYMDPDVVYWPDPAPNQGAVVTFSGYGEGYLSYKGKSYAFTYTYDFDEENYENAYLEAQVVHMTFKSGPYLRGTAQIWHEDSDGFLMHPNIYCEVTYIDHDFDIEAAKGAVYTHMENINNSQPENPDEPETHTHSLTKTDAVSATFEKDGNIEFWSCSGCDKLFADSVGNQEIQQPQTIVEKYDTDDDNHWRSDIEKTLHAVTDGVCTVCAKPVTHTVGLEYELVVPTAKAKAAYAARGLDYEQNGGYYVVKHIGTARGDIVIPATYNGIPVKEIGEYAFYNNDGKGYIYDYYETTSVTLPEGIIKIGSHAFYFVGSPKDPTEPNRISTIRLPQSLLTIEEHAFSITGIDYLVIPKSVTEIGEHCFYQSYMKIYFERSLAEMEDVSIAEMPFFTDSLYYYSETDPSQSGLYWHYENSNIEEFINWVGMTGTFEHFMAKIEVQPDEEGRPRGFIPFESTLTLEITEFDEQQGVTGFKITETEFYDTVNQTRMSAKWEVGQKTAQTDSTYCEWELRCTRTLVYAGRTFVLPLMADISFRVDESTGRINAGISIFNTFCEELMEFENYCRELLQDDFVAVDPGFITFGLDIL